MSHFVGFVIAEDLESAKKLLERYDGNIKIEAHFVKVDTKELATFYHLDENNTSEMLGAVYDWHGCQGILSNDGTIGYMSEFNPEAKFNTFFCREEKPIQAYEAATMVGKECTYPVLIDRDGFHATKTYGWGDAPLCTEEDIRDRLLDHLDAKVFIIDFY